MKYGTAGMPDAADRAYLLSHGPGLKLVLMFRAMRAEAQAYARCRAGSARRYRLSCQLTYHSVTFGHLAKADPSTGAPQWYWRRVARLQNAMDRAD